MRGEGWVWGEVWVWHEGWLGLRVRSGVKSALRIPIKPNTSFCNYSCPEYMILEHIISKMVVIAFNFFHSKIKTWNPPTKFQLYKSKVEQIKKLRNLDDSGFCQLLPIVPVVEYEDFFPWIKKKCHSLVDEIDYIVRSGTTSFLLWVHHIFFWQPDTIGSLSNLAEFWLDGNLLQTIPAVSYFG